MKQDKAMAEFPVSLTTNALTVLAYRYLRKDEQGRVVETPEEMFMRVARVIAAVDQRYDPHLDLETRTAQYYALMAELRFLPNSPTLMNAGTPLGQLAACFVLPVQDDLSSIFNAVHDAALIHQSGGGVGYTFSHLRPQNDVVRSTGGVASGPVSFMQVFDQATEVIKQGGRRRGANMGVLRVDHPDILTFIHAKDQEGVLTNFNLSVAVTDAFMEAVQHDVLFPLRNPRSGDVVRTISARHIMDEIVAAAWRGGDPGVIFLDTINRHNPIPQVGSIETTNPCGEQPLLPYESCILGSINLARHVRHRAIDWPELRRVVRLAVQFLDNVIEVNQYPLSKVAAMSMATRKIGLGVLGWADLLIQLGIPYTDPQALRLAGRLMRTVTHEARQRSVELGSERGSFQYFRGSRWERQGYEAMRNATVTTIAPTGTLSIIAGASSGIEPLFAVAYVRQGLDGVALPEVNPYFLQQVQAAGLEPDALLDTLTQQSSIQHLSELPEALRRVFVTTFDVPPAWHVRMQAAFQRYTDNAVSKTVNLPNAATIEDVRTVYGLAYNTGCKGVTVYRDGSRAHQVLYQGKIPGYGREDGTITVHAEYGGECKLCSV
jgi:ribonucleoside-diphosphate reductase alpha chain